jgi:hypothetical protein
VPCLLHSCYLALGRDRVLNSFEKQTKLGTDYSSTRRFASHAALLAAATRNETSLTLEELHLLRAIIPTCVRAWRLCSWLISTSSRPTRKGLMRLQMRLKRVY